MKNKGRKRHPVTAMPYSLFEAFDMALGFYLRQTGPFDAEVLMAQHDG